VPARELLRAGLLVEVSLLVVGMDGPAGSYGISVREASQELGARVDLHTVGDGAAVDETAMDTAVASILAEKGGLDVLVVDGSALFAAGGLGACLEGVWEATRAVAGGAFLPAARGGRIAYLAPAPGADRSKIVKQADAARAGLENLARTLSVEWARRGITVVTIALGDGTAPGEVAMLVAYLASPAGAYFSGCQLDLRGVVSRASRDPAARRATRDRGGRGPYPRPR
jgi:NAD(P)-dependent dehydrogenase (short-subunit alcohol dehydrogenase family)